MNQRIFITGTDTDCGKTYVSTQLIKSLVSQGYSVKGLKPIASGALSVNNQLRNDDALKLIEAANVPIPYEKVNPYCFESPIAPHIAANNNQQLITIGAIKNHIDHVDSVYQSDYTLIEGVGGWQVPLNQRENIADMAKALNANVILVVGMKLGCLNHALLTAQSINHHRVNFAGWIANYLDQDMLNRDENLQTLQTMIEATYLGMVGFNDSNFS